MIASRNIGSYLLRLRRSTIFTTNPTFLAVLLLISVRSGLGARTEQDVHVLETGRPVTREIAGGQVHNYEISLEAGQYVHVAVNQRGIDLVVTLTGPNDKRLAVIDSPNGSWGPEEVSIIASSAERYRLEVRSLQKEAASGGYEVVLDVLRVAQPQDQIRVDAQHAYAEGEALRTEATAESLRRAIQKYEKALSLRQSVHDRRQEALTLTAIGELYGLLGEQRVALDFYDRALPILREIGDDGEIAGMLNYIGVNHHYLGEYQKALECFGEETRLHHAVGNRYGESGALSNVGTAYRYLGDYTKALEYLMRALELRRAVGHAWGEAYTLTDIGQVYRSLGDYQRALDYLTRALPLRRSSEDRRGEAITLSAIGEVHDSLNEKERALEYFQQALSLERTIGDRGGEVETLTHIGTVYASFGERQKALDHYSLALAIERAINNRVAESRSLYQIAQVERDRGNLIEARKQIEAAFEIFDSLRSKVASQELRASYFATLKGSYDLYVDLLMRLHRREPTEGFDLLALKASEAARARILLELLWQADANIRPGVDTPLLMRERTARELFNAKVEGQIRLLSGKHTDAEAAAAVREIESVKAEYERLNVEIRSASPRYAALTQPRSLSVSEIQGSLWIGTACSWNIPKERNAVIFGPQRRVRSWRTNYPGGLMSRQLRGVSTIC